MNPGGDRTAFIPVCDEGASGNWSRAFSERLPNKMVAGVVEPDTGLREHQENPPERFLGSLFTPFDPKSICWRPDGVRDGERAFFLHFDRPPTRGGRRAPYPKSIPDCAPHQDIKRIALKNQAEPMLIAADSLIPAQWRDPRDGELGDLQKAAGTIGALGMCQAKVAAGPDRFGLFLAFSEAKAAALKELPLSNNTQESTRVSQAMRNALPQEMQRCASSDGFVAEYAALARAINDENRRAFELTRDPFIVNVTAPKAAEAIELQLPFPLEEKQFDFLTAIAAFGLSFDLSPEDLLAKAGEIADPASADDFLYRFFVLTTIGVARNHHAANAEKSAISRNFGAFARDISAAVADGRIGIRIRNAADSTFSPEVFASYDPVRNDIAFPPIDATLILESLVGPMIHELTHAFHDMHRRQLAVVEKEEAASTAGIATEALLASRTPVPSPSESNVLRGILAEMAERERDRQYTCMGYDEELLRRSKMQKQDADSLMATWSEGIALAALGEEAGDLSGLFRAAYRRRAYHNEADPASIRWVLHVGARADRGLLPDPRGDADQALARMNADYSVMLQAPEESTKRAQAARSYIDHLAEASALAFYADRDLWQELNDLLFNSADFLGDALLYQRYNYDGI